MAGARAKFALIANLNLRDNSRIKFNNVADCAARCDPLAKRKVAMIRGVRLPTVPLVDRRKNEVCHEPLPEAGQNRSRRKGRPKERAAESREENALSRCSQAGQRM